MRILITGCAGYLGSKVATLLHEKGNEIFGIDLRTPADINLYKKFIMGSVTDPSAMGGIFEMARPDAAVHLAFVVNAMHDEEKEEEVDVRGSELFLGNCEKYKVKKVVFMSSVAAYGAHPDALQPYTETSPIRGNESYSYSKFKAVTDRMAVMFMRNYSHGSFIILRPCLFVGPNTDNSFFEVLKFPFFPQIVDSSGRRDPEFQFIHEDDMAACVVAGIEKELNGIFNVSADGTIKLSEIAEMAGKRKIGLPPWILYPVTSILWTLRLVGSPSGQLDFMRYPWIMDNSKMKRELYQPKYTTTEALKKFMDKLTKLR